MKFAPRDNRSAVSTSRLTLALCLAGLIPLLLYGSAPSWWSQRGVLVEEATADDYAPINQGQLKNIAKAAVAEMEVHLSGGAGDELHALVQSWSISNPATHDFAPVNLGQLKTVARPFYDRLIATGLAAKYPWTGASSQPDDFAIANIGQVKNLFSFGLTSTYDSDSDSDGLSDAWELEHFGTIEIKPSADADGDGFTNLDEFLAGTDPKDFFNGVVPALEIISGNNQTGDPGAFLVEPLAVRVRKPSGGPLHNAPVTFSANSGTFAAAADEIAPESPSLAVRTGPDGQALAYFRSPSIDNVSSVINAVADSPNATSVVEFVAWTNPSLPLPVTNVQAVTLPDGSVEVSWVAGSANEDYYVIKRQRVDGTWEEIGYADAGSLSFTLPPPRNAVDVPDTRNYIVEPTNGVGSAPSAETNPPRVRYAVIDLGSDLRPTRVTNSGYVLLSDGSMTQRWSGGQLQTLEGEYPWGLDINEEGTVVGYVGSNFEAPAHYSPPWLKSSAAVAWPASGTAPIILSSPDFAYSINGRSGQVQSGYAFAIDNDSHVYGGALGNFAQRNEYTDANGDVHPTTWGFYHAGWDFTSGNALGELTLSLVNESYEVTGQDRVVDRARNGITIGRVGANFGDPNWDYGSQFTFYPMGGAYRNTVNGQVVDFRPLRLNSSGTVLAMHMVGHPYARLLYNTVDRTRKDLEITPPVTVWGPNLWAAAINHRRIPMLDPATGKPLLDGSGQPQTKASPQVVGEDETMWDNAATIWEENPRTGRYEMEYLQRLISPDSGWELQNAYDINDNGMIAADGWFQPKDETGDPVGERQWRACLLLPMELIDTKNKVLGDADDVNVEPRVTLAEKKESNIAWIEPHGADDGSGAPDMPQLVLRFRGLGTMGLKIKWKLIVEYKRPNGRVVPEDKVLIPAANNEQQQPWREEALDDALAIFNNPSWLSELQHKDFFGGDAKLTYQLLKSDGTALSNEDKVLFVIGGRNPDDAKCKLFITQAATEAQQPMARFAFAIAKHESKNYNGVGSRYNQFWDKAARFAGIDHQAGEVLWVNNPGETPPKGFGLFQVTGNATKKEADIPRRQLWNWQQNVRGGLAIVASKRGIADRYFVHIQRKSIQHKTAYQGCPPPSISVGSHTFSSADAIQIYGYNGTGKAIISVRYPFDPNKPCGLGATQRWFWNPHNVAGGEPYIRKVEREL